MQFRYWVILMSFMGFAAFAQAAATEAAAKKTSKGSGFVEIGDEAEDAAESAEIAEKKEEKPALKDTEEILSGTVKIMRKNGLTEAFFKDLKESYFIPSGAMNHTIFKAFEASSKTGKKVTFKANKKSRQVLSLESDAPDKKDEGTK